MKTQLIFLILVIVTGLSSCTVTKRQFRSGWYVEWHKPLAQKETAREETNEKITENDKERPAEMIRTDSAADSLLAAEPVEMKNTVEKTELVRPRKHRPLPVVTPHRLTQQETAREHSSVDRTEKSVNQKEPEDPRKVRKQERRENFWSVVGNVLLVLLVIVLIGLVLLALYASAKVGVGMFLLVLLPVILLVLVIAAIISLIDFVWEAGSEVGKVLRKGGHPFAPDSRLMNQMYSSKPKDREPWLSRDEWIYYLSIIGWSILLGGIVVLAIIYPVVAAIISLLFAIAMIVGVIWVIVKIFSFFGEYLFWSGR